MEYFEQGEGTPVLLLHGFPEHPFSWRNQVDPIAEAGFRVIVPSQRGYAGTDAPADAQTYSVKNLVADVSRPARRAGDRAGGLVRPRLGLDACLVLGRVRPRPGARPGQPLHALLHLGIAERHDRNLRRAARAEPLHADLPGARGGGGDPRGGRRAHLPLDAARPRLHDGRSSRRRRKRSRKSRPASSSATRSSSASRSSARRSSPSTSTSTSAPASPAASTGTAPCARTSKRPRAPTT